MTSSSSSSSGSSAEAEEQPKAEEPKAEEPKAEEPKAEAPKAEAPKAEEPKAEAPKAEEPSLDGHWTGGVIKGDSLRWREGLHGVVLASEKKAEGRTSQLTRTGATECTLVTKLGSFQGRLGADGRLHWSDGDVWSRSEVDTVDARNSRQKQEIQEAWDHLEGIPRAERERFKREALERQKEKEKLKDTKAFRAAAYIGKPDLLPSSAGGGWRGPKDGGDTDSRYMSRGDARELPEDLYKSWKDTGRFVSSAEQRMFQKTQGANSDSSEEGKKTKKEKKKKNKEKADKKNKKSKKDKKKKKGKKEKSKKEKKAGKKRKTA